MLPTTNAKTFLRIKMILSSEKIGMYCTKTQVVKARGFEGFERFLVRAWCVGRGAWGESMDHAEKRRRGERGGGRSWSGSWENGFAITSLAAKNAKSAKGRGVFLLAAKGAKSAKGWGDV